MPIDLTPNQARVIGCLMEKSVVTPDQYPLTLNALAAACNQKSSRDPVMSLEAGEVLATIRQLEEKHLVRAEESFKSQVEKFTQRMCNTPFGDYSFDAPQFAIMCVLLLRGSRTPGELKANSGRLHDFVDNNAAVDALKSLIDREGGPLVIELPRVPGRRDPEYMHLLSGEVDVTALAAPPAVSRPTQSARQSEMAELTVRLTTLEQQVAHLTALIEGRD